MKTVYLIRHAERMDFNAEQEWDNKWPERAIEMGLDPTDAPLTEQGIIQATQAITKIREQPIKIYTSPFARCVQTAEILASELGIKMEISTDLTEWMNVDWFWACHEHLEQIHFKDHKSQFLPEPPPFPESRDSYPGRCIQVLETLTSMNEDRFPLALVTHGGGIHHILNQHDDKIMIGKSVGYADVFRIELY
jgi:broad specificity phosphatase PhoE